MAVIFHEVSVARSRRLRQCSWCAGRIEIGEPYRAYEFRDGGDHGYVALHPECYSAMQELTANEGWWFEWSIGDFNRGCTCQNGFCKCVVEEGE